MERDNDYFIITTDKTRFQSIHINHPSCYGNISVKLEDGTLIGKYNDIETLEYYEFINTTGFVKILIYDENDNIIPCEDFPFTNLNNETIFIPASILCI